MNDWDAIDRLIFRSDTALDEVNSICKWFRDRIEIFIEGGFWDDRAFIPKLEVMIAMLGVLSSRYGNSVVDRPTVLKWKEMTLSYFENESQKAGDEAAVRKWRNNIEANFDRLFHAVE